MIEKKATEGSLSDEGGKPCVVRRICLEETI